MRVLLSETVETPLDKDLEKDAPWKSLAVYDIDDVQTAAYPEYDKNDGSQMLKGVKFDVKTYEELKRWQHGPWDGDLFMQACNKWVDGADVASLIVFEWQPCEELREKIVDFYQTEIGPMFSMVPEILRLRLFQIKDTTAQIADSDETSNSENFYRYMSITEMNCEEWPWGEIFALNELSQWSEYFEGQKAVKWQASHYVVKRSYPDREN
ncbi:hypothetical protein N0V95_007070 [Ascochyta clinopodiicola]|nr:hypothetical protein N0V95_007070 [Ascochyta clinopodiicola]